ncbi:muscle M-line assembly protein unc-89-like [Ruditapes philippinarum]|uniref:muscle M-line assembly protein unc-89-like n=1 Tax=Ruditapes philippinarum TaxID=129788 RepID=UPI00295B2607|nr:muscle M-line assembly protein unc-89-like [Ruditapes philippinarum]
MTTTLTCETSAGRPAASITWRKMSGKGISTDLTQTAKYNISELDNGMIISESSIDLKPLRLDNNTHPPGKPLFQFIAQNDIARDGEIQHNKLIVKEGSSFTVICRTDADPPPTYTWNISNDVKSPNLTFTNITKADIRLHECTAENEMQRFPKYERKKSISKAVLDIDVQYPSRILQFSVTDVEKKREYFEVTENETIHFICSVDSNPVSSISLSYNEQEVWHNVSKGFIYTDRVESCFDAGVYTCSASNKYNYKPFKEELTLRVRCTPLLSPEFYLKTNITSAKNVTVTFQFKSIAYPEPTFKWFKLTDSSWETLDNNKKFETTTHGLNSSLTIRDITEDDCGWYKLKINNTVGSLEQFYFLKAHEKPDQPTSFEYLPEYVTGTSAILQWKPGFDGGLEQTFTLRYKLQIGNNWTTIILLDVGDKTMYYSPIFLESESVYYSELYSENSEGKSMKLNLTFKTNALERTTDCTMTWTLVFVSASTFVITILVGIVATICFRIIRRKQSLTKSTLQTAEITVLNQTTFNSDDIYTTHEYEQLDEHSLEDREYTEMQTMEAGDDPNRDYITPIF